MPRSRSSRRSSAKRLTKFFSRLARAINGSSGRPTYLLEPLEERLQFVILGPADGVLEILDAKKNTIRIAWHDMTVELIGAAVGTPDNTQGLPVDVATETAFTPGSILLPPGMPPAITANIFTIYVLQSTPNSWFEAALVPPITQIGTRSEEPFTGSAGPFLVNNSAGDGTTLTFSPPGDSGVALLGATHTGTLDSTEPIFEMPDNGSTDGPRSNLFIDPNTGNIIAGLYMSPIAMQQNPADPITPSDFVPITQIVNGVTYDTPNDIGYFHWAGTMFGNVVIPSPASEGFSVPPPSAANSANPQLNSQGGNIGEFYAGCILTGDATGAVLPVAGEDISDETPNFIVDGDIRDLVTSGPIGGNSATGPTYITDFDAQVEGTVGQIYLREGDFLGSLDVEHEPSIYGLPDNVFTEPELEVKPNGGANSNGGVGPIFRGIGTIGGIAIGFPDLPTPFNDDTASTNGAGVGTPQYLGSIKMTDPKTGLPLLDVDGNQEYASEVSGTLQATTTESDTADDYAVPLLAGQTIAIEPDTGVVLPVEVIDPDGRVVASDLKNIDQPFEFTPDRPGEYTISVIANGSIGNFAYTLEIQGVGDMGLGTLSVPAGSVTDLGVTDAIEVGNGDLGGIVAGNNVLSSVENATGSLPPPLPSIAVPNGNLRTIKGGSVGMITKVGTTTTANGITTVTPAVFGNIPTISVPNGTVGLIDGFNAAGVCAIQTLFDLNNVASNDAPTPTAPFEAVGGDFQRIDGAGLVWLDIATNQGIGVINAGNMQSNPASFIDVNADNIGSDGIIDLIDCTGDLGTLAFGGPGIVTHDGGYVRYMHVGGQIFQDKFFGGGSPTNVTYDPGQTVTITDDTGATVQFVPQGTTTTLQVVNPNNPNLPINETFGPQVNLTTYGIRDKGGPVIVDASVTNNFVSGTVEALFDGTTATLTGQALGLTITAGSNGAANNEADISSIGIEGESSTTIGPSVNATTGLPITDSNGEQELATITPAGLTTLNTLNLIINGSSKVDVMDVVAFQQTTNVPADVDEIENNTPGEILSVSAATIGTLFSAGSIGLASTTTPTAIITSQAMAGVQSWNDANNNPTPGTGTLGNTAPFSDQGFGVTTSGDVQSITANQGVGNIIVAGTIGSVVADANGKITPGVFSGIDGPIVAAGATATTNDRILSVSIGQGILFSGTGSLSFAGLYALGDIGTVTNNGQSQADIRGNIVSETSIDNINLFNGSLINSDVIVMAPAGAVGVQADFSRTELTSPTSFLVTSSSTSISSPTNTIRQVTIGGNGGILSSEFIGSNLGPVLVGKQGFGIFSATFLTGGNGVFGNISAGGYGIRSSSIESGAVVQGFNATGNGSQLPVTNFGTDVRPSDLSGNDGFDPFTGFEVDALDDLNAALGTSAQVPVVTGSTDTGVLEDDVIAVSTSIGNVNAQTIRVSLPAFQQDIDLPLEPAPNIPVVGQPFAMEFNAAGSISSINVRGNIDGLEVTTGHLGAFTQRGSVSRLGISVTGAISSLVIHGNFGQLINDPLTNDLIPDSYIVASGAAGSIKSLTIDGDLNGNVSATNSIGRLTVGGNVGGSITAQGGTSGLTLGYLRVAGGMRDGSLVVDGNAGTIITNGGLGSSTGSLTVAGNLNSLSVGALHSRKGSSLELPLHVEGSVGSLTVFGRIDGTVQIDGDLKTLKVTNDGTQSNIINGNMTIGGRLGTANIIDGNVAANVIANNTIKSFTISRGSVLAAGSVQSQIDAIQNFRITGGASFGMFGSLLAPSGLDDNIDISGDVGDGVDAASIIAATGNRFRVRGSIASGANMAVTGQLNLLQVDHDIKTGANVSAHPLKKLIVGGTNTGNVITV
jgi:hypothetical protein